MDSQESLIEKMCYLYYVTNVSLIKLKMQELVAIQVTTLLYYQDCFTLLPARLPRNWYNKDDDYDN